jgi:nucleoid DNA-binding protein
MTKLDIIQDVVNQTGISKRRGATAVETVQRAPRKLGLGRNPRTGTAVAIAPGESGALQARQGTAGA